KQLIGPIWDGYANTTIYCNTSRTTGKAHVTLSIGSDGVTMAEESQPGVYAVGLEVNTWRDHDGDIKGSDPILNMPEYIHDENTTASCEVSNARPPASIEILVDNQAISEAVKNDILDETSKTFAMLTQPLNFSLDIVQNSTSYSTTGETDLKGSSMNEISANGLCNEMKCTASTNKATKGGIKKGKPTNSRENGTKFRQEYTSAASDNSTRSFKISLEPILIGTGAFAVLCIFVASARTLVQWHKGRSRTIHIISDRSFSLA
ncbi:hypothetical protein MAR_022019, partial [Mya arenaria]